MTYFGPVTFDQLGILTESQEKLKSMYEEDRVPHALYLQGEDGGGSLPLAIAFAHLLLSADSKDLFGAPDIRAAHLEHPDLHIVFPVVQGKDKTCGPVVNEMRAAYHQDPLLSFEKWSDGRGEKDKKAIISKFEAQSIAQKLSLSSFEGGRRVMLIWLPERMNRECANKILKLIEEPPRGVIFLLVGEDAEQLLPTIRSRVQLLRVPPVGDEEMVEYLSNLRAESEEHLWEAVEYAEGNVSKALSFLTEKPEYDQDEVIEWLRLCYQRKVPEVMDWCSEMASGGRELTKSTLRQCQEIFRLALRRNFIEERSSTNEVLDTFIKKFSPFIHAGNSEGLTSAVEKAIADIERNGNVRIILLDLAFKVMKALRVKQEDAI